MMDTYMNNRFVGSDAREVIRKWEREDPTIRIEIEKAKEKKKIAYLMKLARLNSEISQQQLSKKADIPSSVISRIESTNSTVLPRLDLLTRLFGAMGYRMSIQLEKV